MITAVACVRLKNTTCSCAHTTHRRLYGLYRFVCCHRIVLLGMQYVMYGVRMTVHVQDGRVDISEARMSVQAMPTFTFFCFF